MDEQKTQVEKETKDISKNEETTTEDNAIRKPSEGEEDIVKRAKDAATIAKEAEELKANNLSREEKLLARKEALAALGGNSDAGTGTNQVEQTPKEYADEVMSGKMSK